MAACTNQKTLNDIIVNFSSLAVHTKNTHDVGVIYISSLPEIMESFVLCIEACSLESQ